MRDFPKVLPLVNAPSVKGSFCYYPHFPGEETEALEGTLSAAVGAPAPGSEDEGIRHGC